MEEFALKTSSRKATSTLGKYPSVFLENVSFFNSLIDNGPNSSSGVVNFVSRYSK